VLIARLRSGEEVILQTEKYTASELRAKLVPIISQLRKANASPSPTALPVTFSPSAAAPPAAGPPPAAPVSVADEPKKLAETGSVALLFVVPSDSVGPDGGCFRSPLANRALSAVSVERPDSPGTASQARVAGAQRLFGRRRAASVGVGLVRDLPAAVEPRHR
jgi:hypothetical protein